MNEERKKDKDASDGMKKELQDAQRARMEPMQIKHIIEKYILSGDLQCPIHTKVKRSIEPVYKSELMEHPKYSTYEVHKPSESSSNLPTTIEEPKARAPSMDEPKEDILRSCIVIKLEIINLSMILMQQQKSLI